MIGRAKVAKTGSDGPSNIGVTLHLAVGDTLGITGRSDKGSSVPCQPVRGVGLDTTLGQNRCIAWGSAVSEYTPSHVGRYASVVAGVVPEPSIQLLEARHGLVKRKDWDASYPLPKSSAHPSMTVLLGRTVSTISEVSEAQQ